MAKILQRITLVFVSCLMISATCDKGSEGCTDPLACNYDETAVIDNGTCGYPAMNYDCTGNCIEDVDCKGVCGGSAKIDNCGICCSGTTEIECNFGDNCMDSCPDGEQLGCFGCMNVLIVFDCDSVCGGEAFIDDCDQCVGGTTNESTINNIPIDWEGDNCHHYDHEYGKCIENWAMDCYGDCFGTALKDACIIPNCFGGESEKVEEWRIKVLAGLTENLIDLSSYDSLILGASKNATDDYDNDFELINQPGTPDSKIDIYISNEKWNIVEPIPSFCCEYFTEFKDLESTITDWNTSITTGPEVDSLFFIFKIPDEDEIINFFSAKVTYKNESYIMDEDNLIKFEINETSIIDSIQITIYDICFN